MKTRCELTEPELRKLLDKKKISVKFPDLKNKLFYLIIFVLIIMIPLMGIVSHKAGYSKGKSIGYNTGFKEGHKQSVEYTSLTLSEAIALNIKHNLDSYFGWFGLVVGLGWVFHGVGFRILG